MQNPVSRIGPKAHEAYTPATSRRCRVPRPPRRVRESQCVHHPRPSPHRAEREARAAAREEQRQLEESAARAEGQAAAFVLFAPPPLSQRASHARAHVHPRTDCAAQCVWLPPRALRSPTRAAALLRCAARWQRAHRHPPTGDMRRLRRTTTTPRRVPAAAWTVPSDICSMLHSQYSSKI